MSLLDENISVSFGDLLKSLGWDLQSMRVRINRGSCQNKLVTANFYTYDGADCNNHRYIINYYPIGSYLYVYGIKLRKSVVVVSAPIYERNSDAEIIGSWNACFELRCNEDELMNLWTHIKNGIFNPKFYKKFTYKYQYEVFK